MESRKVILFIAMSLDGYIATENDDLSFLDVVAVQGEDYGYAHFVNHIDTIIWGRKTFDKVVSFGGDIPYADKKVFVISRTRSGKKGHVQFVENVVPLIEQLKSEEGLDIYCDGGGEIVSELLKHQLIDEMIISVIPHLLGKGKKLFMNNRPPQKLEFVNAKSYKSGLVQLRYRNIGSE
ncbi:MAG TPA: dihydrofolate reductase family protein [Saprospiraceae bacterium]|nr:dihydrofolate reductase family protein [Saprospiraceae bacterium]HPN69668.1 dihydrofolate reductase family protein [Saprospiraceae bacterium]